MVVSILDFKAPFSACWLLEMVEFSSILFVGGMFNEWNGQVKFSKICNFAPPLTIQC